VLSDFSRLVAAAAAVGVLTSALAAAGALFLATEREAAASATETWVIEDGFGVLNAEVEQQRLLRVSALPLPAESPLPPTKVARNPQEEVATHDASLRAAPGSLYLGDDGDRTPVAATERDWYVRIDGIAAHVKVMQTFTPLGVQDHDSIGQMDEPAASGEEPLARMPVWFHARLPKGATLTHLSVETQRDSWQGRVMDSDVEGTPAADGAAFDVYFHKGVAGSALGALTTALLPDVREGETLVVVYSYVVLLDHPHHNRGDLQPPSRHVLSFALDDCEAEANSSTPGMVWVEWAPQGAPTAQQLIHAPKGSIIERRQGRVLGLSWHQRSIQRGEEFHLGWN
jgi:hypothetical protein